MAPRHHHRHTDSDGGYDPRTDPNSSSYDRTRDPNSDYYIDRGDTSDTRDQTRQHAEQTADQQEQGDDGLLAQIINMITRSSREDSAYDQGLNQQASELAEGVDTRPPPPMMTANYMNNPHTQLKSMVTEGVNPDTVGEMGDTWIEAGNAMTRFQSGVGKAINNSETDWQGTAGNSARMFMADVGNWVGSAGQSAQLAGTQTNIQATALAQAKRSMPEPVEFDVAAANRDLQATTDPTAYMDKYNNYMSTYNSQQEAHQQAARVVSTFDSSLAGASTMPAFAEPPKMSGGGGPVNPKGTKRVGSTEAAGNVDSANGGSTGSSGSVGGAGGGGGGAGIPPGGGGGAGGAGGAGGGGAGGSGGLPGGGSTGAGGTNPSGGGPGGGGPGGVPLPGGGTGAGGGQGAGGANSNIPGGGAPLPIGMGGVPGGSEFERGGGRFGTGGGRFGPGSGFGSGSGSGFGSGGSGGGGVGGSGGGAGGVGRGGVGPGGLGAGAGSALAAEEAAAMRGGAAGAGRGGGMGGMGAMGGGRGQGEDDDEHQRASFLVEGDPDAVFGTDEMTAPPVIGE